MVVVLLLEREGCVEHIFRGMRLGVGILPQMWIGRSCCLRYKKNLYRYVYGLTVLKKDFY
jgi:hypothetical protein